MYCCGMRPEEPLKLLKEDVRLETGEIYIRKDKNWQDRRILMSKELLELSRKYANQVYTTKYFFENRHGESFNSEWSRIQFNYCWDLSGLSRRKRVRPYDLRHNFATRTIQRWLSEGKDFHMMVSYLSAYMGHSEFSSTLYYVNLLPKMFLDNSGIDWKQFSQIYPEVSHEDN